MMKIRFVVDVERVTLDQTIGMQDGELRAMRDVLATCLVDENGEYVPFEQAQREIGALTLGQVREAANEFMAALRDGAVNPPIGGG